MPAWSIDEAAPVPVLRRVDVAVPRAPADGARVRVIAGGLNFSDLLMARGAYQVRPPVPFVPGQEVVGTVVERGAGCPFAEGDTIAAKVLWGGFAREAVVDAAMARHVPAGVDAIDALVLPVIAVTAWIALFDRARLAAGGSVLVHAGAGALGQAALGLARACGLRAYATVGDAGKCEIARAAGAHQVFVYRDDGWIDEVRAATDGRGVDAILDSVGGAVSEASIRALAREGLLLAAGFSSGQIPAVRLNRLLLRNVGVLGVYWSHADDRERVDAAHAAIDALIARGAWQPRVPTRYPFDALPQALDDLAQRRTTGKCALLAPAADEGG